MGEKLSIAAGIPVADEPGQGAQTIGGYLRELAARHGPNEALVLRSGDQRLVWTYNELLARSMDVARSLIACGAGRGARVGLLMTNRMEFLSALFGTALAGGVPVALSTFSTPSELDYLLSASEISLLLFEQHVLKTDFQAMIAELEPAIIQGTPGALVSARYPYLQRLVSLGGLPGGSDPLESAEQGAVERWDSFLEHGSSMPDAVVLARADGVVPSDPGGIFFSSGTTSLPKGIVHTQRAFAIQWWRWPRIFCMHEPVRSWTCNGFFWSGNISMVAGSALSTGGAIILQRYFDAEEALRLMEQERASFINGRPHQWVKLKGAANWASADLSSLKYIPRGEMIWEHPSVDTDWDVPMAFGTTETFTVCTGFTADTSKVAYNGSFGAPHPGNRLKIIDQHSGDILPLGAVGELCVKGPTLMTGYLGKAPEECFDDEGYYRTGDCGRLDEQGRFYWEGRLTEMIKTGGANVAPMEVDTVIARFPGVKRSQTVGVPDELLGEMVVSCLVPADGVTLDADAVTAFVKQELASFKVPRRILFFTDADYALTGNEKIKLNDLRAMAAARLGG